MKNIKTQYYKHFTDDFLETKNQDYQVPENYQWINNSALYRLGANALFVIAKIYTDGIVNISAVSKPTKFLKRPITVSLPYVFYMP